MDIQVFSAGSIPGVAATAFTNGVQPMPNGHFQHVDSQFFPQELTHVTTMDPAELYRPAKWRRYIPVEPVPVWAQVVEDRKIKQLVEDPVLVSGKAPTQELPMPSYSKDHQFLPLYAFGLAYGYTDDDIMRAAKLGTNLETENVSGCMLAVERFLEKIASVGITNPTLKGLGNLADVSSVTAVTKAATGTTWAVATASEIVEDLHRIADSIETNTLETLSCNQILIPLSQYQKANKTRTDSLERSALRIFREERPGVAIDVWNKLSNQGAGSTPCAMALDTTDPNRPKMLMQYELKFGTPLRGTNGWIVPGYVAVSGVRCKNLTAVSKMSGL